MEEPASKEEKEAEPPKVIPSRKREEKILEEEKSESEWEEDVDAAIEEAISRVTRIEESDSSLSDLIISITIDEQPAVSPA